MPFVKYCVNHNMVTVDGQKMGKSLNNFITLKQIFKEGHERLTRLYDPVAVRQLILQSHYRSPIDFSDAALSAAQSGYDRITEAVLAVRKAAKTAPAGEVYPDVQQQLDTLRKKFEDAMNDDLNTAVALSVIFEMVKLVNQTLAEGGSVTAETLSAIDEQFRTLCGEVLGIVKDEYETGGGTDDELLEHLMQLMIEQRQTARKNKDFATADMIRTKLTEFGVVLEDSPQGTTWRRA